MADSLLLSIAALAALVGLAWLALAMPEHWEQVHGAPCRAQRRSLMLRLLGGAGLMGSAVLLFQADRPSMAALVWLMLLSGSAALTAMALAWKPTLLKLLFPGPRQPADSPE